jgi:hypothetical protein
LLNLLEHRQPLLPQALDRGFRLRLVGGSDRPDTGQNTGQTTDEDRRLKQFRLTHRFSPMAEGIVVPQATLALEPQKTARDCGPGG